jgi:hypothetical protein
MADNHRFFDVTTSSYSHSGADDDQSTGTNLGKRQAPSEPIKPPKVVPKTTGTSKAPPPQTLLYHPDIDFSNLTSCLNKEIEVKVEVCYVSPFNPNVQAGKLFGTDFYTSTSDFVAIFLHSKFYNPDNLKKKPIVGISLTFSVSKQRRNYTSTERNGIISKKLNVSNTVNFQTIKLENFRTFNSWKMEEIYSLADRVTLPDRKRTKIVPERKDSNVQPRFNNLVFNMNNELAIEYNVINICEKSADNKDFLSNLLKRHYMVIETAKGQKFVLTTAHKDNLRYFPDEFMYKLMQIKSPLEFDNEHFQKHKLPTKKLSEIVKSIAWEDVIWSQSAITFSGANFEIHHPVSFKFYRIPDGADK